MVSDVVISNMRGRGFRFNEDGIPIVCASPLDGRELPDGNPYGSYGMVLGDYEFAYRHDRTLYIQYPSKTLMGDTLCYTLTFAFDLDGFPVERDDGLTTDEIINQHWMAGTTWGGRLDRLRQVPDSVKHHPVRWWKNGQVVYELTIGEVIDRFLDPVRLEAHRDYVKRKMDAMREQAPVPMRPKAESDPIVPEFRRQKSAVAPEPKMVKAGKGVRLTEQSDGSILAERESTGKPVLWHPRKPNGFQHVDLESDLPDRVERLALEHSTSRKESRIPPNHAVLRGWGDDLDVVVINGVSVGFVYNAEKHWFESDITAEQLRELV